MGAFSLWHWLIVLIVVILVFGGRGKISSFMSDLGKGFRSFKDEIDNTKTHDPTTKDNNKDHSK